MLKLKFSKLSALAFNYVNMVNIIRKSKLMLQVNYCIKLPNWMGIEFRVHKFSWLSWYVLNNKINTQRLDMQQF